MIRFENVSYSYNADKSKYAIDDFSLHIGKGEEIAVMGGNGSGKTTLGLLLCGVLKPDSGKVTIDGSVNGSTDDKPPIGFLFQDPDNGLVATTVEREIAFSLENRNMPSDEMGKIVDRVVGLFDMGKYRERLVWNLSGGEKQRLSLAGLFASGPKILFLDEPASYLDHPGSERLDQALRQIKGVDPELTIIRVTQYPTVADNYKRLVILGEGKIISDDSPDRIFADGTALRKTGIRPPYKYMKAIAEFTGKTDSVPGPTANDTFMEVDNISFSYEQGEPIFDGLSLNINRGEVLGLVGASGSGKSTLAQLICGIYKPLKGSVRFANDGHRAVMSFQQPERQFFLDTCYNEVAYGIKGKYESNTLIDEAVRKCMEIVGLDYDLFKDRDPHSLSGGEARRLGFAIVVALEAELIVFDEPTCGLDEAGLLAFKKMLGSLREGGKTSMIISHNSEIIADLTDRVGLLSDGRIVSTPVPLDFFNNNLHKGILSIPEVIAYQQAHYDDIVTTHPDDIFAGQDFFS